MFALCELKLSEETIDYGETAFANCGALKTVDLRSVKIIERAAFNGTSLQTVNLSFTGRSVDSGGEESMLGYIFGYEEL